MKKILFAVLSIMIIAPATAATTAAVVTKAGKVNAIKGDIRLTVNKLADEDRITALDAFRIYPGKISQFLAGKNTIIEEQIAPLAELTEELEQCEAELEEFTNEPSPGCEPGTFCPTFIDKEDPEVPSKFDCPIGYYCPAESAAPRTCDPSHYCVVTNLEAQPKCAAGYYCPEPSYRVPCGIGNYCPTGSIAPIPTEPGYYTGTTTGGAQILCDAGYYCPGGVNKITCPAGSYCSAGASEPTVCTNQSACPLNSTRNGTCNAITTISTRTSSAVLCPIAWGFLAGWTAPAACWGKGDAFSNNFANGNSGTMCYQSLGGAVTVQNECPAGIISGTGAASNAKYINLYYRSSTTANTVGPALTQIRVDSPAIISLISYRSGGGTTPSSCYITYREVYLQPGVNYAVTQSQQNVCVGGHCANVGTPTNYGGWIIWFYLVKTQATGITVNLCTSASSCANRTF